MFRDYAFDEVPMEESEFFKMPEDIDVLKAFLDRQEIAGGGDFPENGLEALYYAMRSDFDISAKRNYQTIVLITDADAHPLKEQIDLPNYPKDMVDEATLKDMWTNSRDYPELKLAFIKRLEFFAPNCSIYRRMAEDMFPVCFTALDCNKGAAELNDISPEEFAETIIYDTFYRMD